MARILIDFVVFDGTRNSDLRDLVLDLDLVVELLWLAPHSLYFDYFFGFILALVDTAISTRAEFSTQFVLSQDEDAIPDLGLPHAFEVVFALEIEHIRT